MDLRILGRVLATLVPLTLASAVSVDVHAADPPRHRGAHPAKEKADKADNADKADKAERKPERRASRTPGNGRRTETVRRPKPRPVCLRDPVELDRRGERVTIALTDCDGLPAPLAVEHLSLMARPDPSREVPVDVTALARKKSDDLAPGVRRLDARLVQRLAQIVARFTRGAATPRVVLVSGFRPSSPRSYHASGHALDFRLEGVKNEDLVDFCKTLPDAGCGYYPNSGFVHLDVRETGAGHVAWIDASGPGEKARYVPTWPPPLEQIDALPRPELAPEEHEAEAKDDEAPAPPSNATDMAGAAAVGATAAPAAE